MCIYIVFSVPFSVKCLCLCEKYFGVTFGKVRYVYLYSIIRVIFGKIFMFVCEVSLVSFSVKCLSLYVQYFPCPFR